MKTIVIGMGKIGRLKANVYKNNGYYVAGYDTNVAHSTVPNFDTIHTKLTKYVTPSDYDVVDICVSTKSHLEVLQKVINFFPNSHIIVEKPLVSNRKQLNELKTFLNNNSSSNILYSENYVFSNALDFTKNYIKSTNLNINSIELEFSKDRRADMSKGRFVDEDLNGFGIEIPHMLAILDFLNITPQNIESCEQSLYGGNSNYSNVNKFIDIKLMGCRDIEISLIQSLEGKHYVTSSHFINPKKEITDSSYRVAKILLSNGETVLIQFEPISGLQRYFSKVTILNSSSEIKLQKIFSDNTLDSLVSSLKNNIIKKFVSLEKAIQINELLILLSENHQKIPYLKYNHLRNGSNMFIG